MNTDTLPGADVSLFDWTEDSWRTWARLALAIDRQSSNEEIQTLAHANDPQSTDQR